MASGLIYVAIVGMWVAYFLPRWVHNHDEFSGKSVERYKSALRVVASSNITGEPGQVLNTAIHTDLDFEAKVAQHLLRRRMIFALLFSLLCTSLIGVAMNLIQILYVLIPLTAIAIYLFHMHRQTAQERTHRRRLFALQRSTEGVSHTNLSPVLTRTSATPQPKSQEHWVPLAERELTGVVILPKGSARERNAWQPTEVPVPTYVNAPKAVQAKRVIDLTEPGRWTEEQERLVEQAHAAAAPSREEIFDQQLAEEAVDRLNKNRAANQ